MAVLDNQLIVSWGLIPLKQGTKLKCGTDEFQVKYSNLMTLSLINSTVVLVLLSRVIETKTNQRSPSGGYVGIKDMMENLIRQFKSQSILLEKPSPVTYYEMVDSYHTFAVGGGEWSIELHAGPSRWSECLAEFVGSNGQCFGEEPDDLWAEVEEWKVDPKGGEAIHHWTEAVFEAPDGTRLTKSQWLRELEEYGTTHGVVLSF